MTEILGTSARSESAMLQQKRVKLYMFDDKNMAPRQDGFPELETVFVYTDICQEQ
jgi:hypothetical protein